MLQLEQFGNSTGKIVYGKTSQSILSLAKDEVLEQFKLSGLLLFRGFGVSYEEMGKFSKQFSSKFARDPERQIVGSSDNFIQLVDNGTHEVRPHCENAASPFRPDIIWFCCSIPATQGGETLFWDGVKVWEQLSEPVKELFLSKRIKFKFNFTVENCKIFFGPETTIAEIKQILNPIKEIKYHFLEDESLYFEYTCSAVVKTKFDNTYAFANSVMIKVNSSLQEPSSKVFFEDGSLIPNAAINEIKAILDKLTGVISWQAGDLVMIDNSRFLHGRRAFQDTRRRIFSHLSYL